MKNKKKFYIGERRNPQFDKPYYMAYGQLSKTAASQKSKTIYGSIFITEYQTEAEYKSKIESLQQNGYRVSVQN